MRELAGRTAVVTGAARGIGRALAIELAGAGMNVVVADVDAAGLAATAEAIGDRALAVPTDVASAPAVEALAAAALDRFDAVHLLCNNAAVQALDLAWEQPLASWERVVGVNLMGTVHGIRTFVPLLLRAGEGHILNTGSMGSLTASVLAAYTTTKHAVLGLSKALLLQLQEVGAPIGVTVLLPGWVDTGMIDRLPEPAGGRERDLRERLGEGTRRGVSASVVAARAVVAIRENQFWAFVDPDTLPALRESFEAMLAGRAPGVPAGE